MSSASSAPGGSPPAAPTDRLRDYAAQTVEYVRRAVGAPLEFDSDTLPLLDHYLRSVPMDQPATVRLVVSTAAAYFGEVVIRRLGGRWDTDGDDELAWRVVLPTGLSFAPAGLVGAALARADVADLDAALEAPLRLRPYVQQALARMSPVTDDEYFSLCGRLDTLEHVHEVLVTVAAQLAGDAVPAADDGGDEPADEPADGPADGGAPLVN